MSFKNISGLAAKELLGITDDEFSTIKQLDAYSNLITSEQCIKELVESERIDEESLREDESRYSVKAMFSELVLPSLCKNIVHYASDYDSDWKNPKDVSIAESYFLLRSEESSGKACLSVPSELFVNAMPGTSIEDAERLLRFEKQALEFASSQRPSSGATTPGYRMNMPALPYRTESIGVAGMRDGNDFSYLYGLSALGSQKALFVVLTFDNEGEPIFRLAK